MCSLNMQEKKPNILDEVKHKSKKETKDILTRARKVADREIGMARTKAEEIIQEKKKLYKEKFDKEKRKILTQINIEFRQKRLSYQHELVQRLFKDSLSQLADLERDENYLNLLKKLILDAIKILDKNDIVIYLNQKDNTFLKSENNFEKIKFFLRQNYKPDIKLRLSKRSIKAAGGVVISTEDGKIKYYNRFEDILERKADILEADILEELFHENE